MKPRALRPNRVLLVLALIISLPVSHRAAPKFASWSAPVNLGGLVNSEYGDVSPHVSKDGLSLYFSSSRPESYGSYGGEDLWVSQRPGTEAPWGSPVNLGNVVNGPSTDRSPALSRDGHYLFFASDRAGGAGSLDLWVSRRVNTHDDFAWEAPVNLGGVVNSAATDAGPAFFANDGGGYPQLFIASNRPGGAGGLDLYVSDVVGGVFQAPIPIAELNTSQLDLTASVGHDGLEMVFASTRPGGAGGFDLWTTVRESTTAAWGSPVNLGATVNSTSGEGFPHLSADRTTLFFYSDRPGGYGGTDLYMSTREK